MYFTQVWKILLKSLLFRSTSSCAPPLLYSLSLLQIISEAMNFVIFINGNFPRYSSPSSALPIFSFVLNFYRNTIMAAASGGADTQRARSRRPLSPDIPRHHRIEAAHRHRRQQRRYISFSRSRKSPEQIQFLTRIKINFELK